MSELLDRLTASERQDWVRYFNAEPWGFPIENVRHGQMSVRVMQSSGLKLDQVALEPSSWMLTHLEEQSDEDLLRVGRMFMGEG